MGAKMYDNGLRQAAGLPERKEIDKTYAIHRFTWYRLPEGIDGELIERIMYYSDMDIALYCKTNAAKGGKK